ncbi:MAG: hypothetical protein DHS20C21_21430 [Gemmatimonadota bacterium]|nr:MAG: hypothetical protein DHS20C21_21430 [Gemmatimonadota bacterium]
MNAPVPRHPLSTLMAASRLAKSLALAGALATQALLPPGAAAQTFTRITGTGTHVTDAFKSLSGAWADYDSDGDTDLYVGNIGASFLYRNDGADVFVTVPGPPTDTTADAVRTMAVWGDYDNDGDVDLYRTTYTFDMNGPTIPLPNDLFRNDGGTFVPVSTGNDSTFTPAASWVDYDADGDLDLFSCGAGGDLDLMYRNDNGTFLKRTALPFLNTHGGGALQSWVDYDADGDADLYMVNHGAPNELWRNLLKETGTAELFEADTTSGLTDDAGEIDFGVSWGDYDNDGDLDGFVSTLGVDKLLRNDGGTFTRITGIPLVQGTQSSSGGSWGDYDNDGDLDLFVPHAASTAQTPDLWRNDGGTFVALTMADVGDLLLNLPGPQTSEWADYDSDGDLDMYVCNHSNLAGNPRVNRLYRNEGSSNAWLHVSLEGVVSNRSAVGAVVRAKATIGGVPTWQMRDVVAGPTSFEFQRELRMHFGFGDAAQVDSLVVEWPCGSVQTLTAVAVNQSLTVVESVAVGVNGSSQVGPLGLGNIAPNPTPGRTHIDYQLTRAAHVDLSVFDVRGRRIRTLVSGPRPAGAAEAVWDGRDEDRRSVPTGMYFVRFETEGDLATRKITLVRTR